MHTSLEKKIASTSKFCFCYECVYLLIAISIHGRLEIPPMHSPQQDMNRIVLLLPNFCLRNIHPLLHVPGGFQSRSLIVGNFRKQRLKVPTLRSAAPFRHQLHQLRVRFVAHTQQGYHFQTVQLGLR